MSARSLAAALLAVFVLVGCAPSPDRTPSPTSPASPGSPAPSASGSATATPAKTTGFVYFIIDTTRGFRLAREPRPLASVSSAEGALQAMIAGPADPDYQSPLPKNTRVLGVTQTDDVITVNLSNEARQANVGASLEAMMVEQLIWTVTESVDPTASVRVTLEGDPASWGHLSWGEPLTRGDATDVRQFVSIDSLAEGATVTSPLLVTGEANVDEASLPWVVLRMDGSTAARGHTSTDEGQVFAPWQITLTLPPGDYMLEVHEGDPSGSIDNRRPDRDSRMFKVA